MIYASIALCAWAGEATIEAEPPMPAAIAQAVIDRLKVTGSPVKNRCPRDQAWSAKSECNLNLAGERSHGTASALGGKAHLENASGRFGSVSVLIPLWRR